MPDAAFDAVSRLVAGNEGLRFAAPDVEVPSGWTAVPLSPTLRVLAPSDAGPASLLRLKEGIISLAADAGVTASLRAENAMLTEQVDALLAIIREGWGDETDIPAMFDFLPDSTRFAVLRDGERLYGDGIDDHSVRIEARRMTGRTEYRCDIGSGQRFVHRNDRYIVVIDTDEGLDDVRTRLVRLTLAQMSTRRREREHHELIERLSGLLGSATRSLGDPRTGSAGDTADAATCVRTGVEADVNRLVDATLRDSLTRIYNRSKVTDMLAELNESSRPYCLVIADIDHFKSVNDEFGHLAGDRVIVEVASCLDRDSRPGDVVARWGGEEFVAVLPGASAETASQVAERWRRRISSDISVDGRAITCSFGVARSRPDGDPDSVLADADAALYRAKRAGRNRVESAGWEGDDLPVAGSAPDAPSSIGLTPTN